MANKHVVIQAIQTNKKEIIPIFDKRVKVKQDEYGQSCYVVDGEYLKF